MASVISFMLFPAICQHVIVNTLCSLLFGRINDRLIDSIAFNYSALKLNRLQPSVIMQLHFECSVPYRSDRPFLISDIRALCHNFFRLFMQIQCFIAYILSPEIKYVPYGQTMSTSIDRQFRFYEF